MTLVCEKIFSVNTNVSRLELIKANNQSFNDKNKSNNNNFDSSNTNSSDGKYNYEVLKRDPFFSLRRPGGFKSKSD